MDKKIKSAVDLQREIFLGGLRGERPTLPLLPKDLRGKAKAQLCQQSFNYLDGGAGSNQTDINNRSAFNRWQIIPQMLRDVSKREIAIDLFGQKLSSPFFLCPIGVLELAHQEADLAVARACEITDMPLIISSQASIPMEKIASEMPNTPWFFQLYWSKSEALVHSFVARAESLGCKAIVVTLDTTLLGWRVKDLDSAYLPFLYGMGLAQYIGDPVFQALLQNHPSIPDAKPKLNFRLIKSLWKMARNYPGATWKNFHSRAPLNAIRKFIEIYMNPSLQWEDLKRLRRMTKLPIVLKGIQHPDDARKAVDAGMDGLYISNHGGRQIDGAIASLEALRLCKERIPDTMPVLFDSGIRSGADAFKALALGADAIGIGRPYAYALSLEGAVGVQSLVENFRAEFELTMALSGCRNIEEIDRDLLYC